MDTRVHRSVATRKRPWTETPAPPPMQMPSSSATCGFMSCPSVWFSEYSSRKNLGSRVYGGLSRSTHNSSSF